MEAPSPALRPNRTVLVAILLAALAVMAFSAVGIASLFGWLPERQKASFIPPDERKGANEPAPRAPRETLAPIEAGKRSDPLMPRYSTPSPPPAAPEAPAPGQPAPRPGLGQPAIDAPRPAASGPLREEPMREAPAPRDSSGARESYAGAREPAYPGARSPNYANAPREPASPGAARAPRGCDGCGRVSGISYRGGLYEVRVRFEDGSFQAFRYRSRPSFEPGDRVRLNGDFLDLD